MEEKNNLHEKTPKVDSQNKDQSASGNKKIGLVLGVLVLVAVLAFGYLYLNGDLKLQPKDEDSAAMVNGLPQPELLDDEAVVARVNGEEVYGEEVNQQILTLHQQLSFFDPASITPEVLEQLRDEAVNSVVNTVVLRQAALASEIEISEEEVGEQYDQVLESLGGEAEIDSRLEEFGLSKDQLKNTIEDNVLIQKYLDSLTEADVEVSEEEARALYEQIAANSGQENAPTFEEVRLQLEERIKQQKEQESLFELIEELRAEAEVEVLI